MPRRIIFLIAFLLLATLFGSRTQADEVLITGKVVDQNGVPLVDVFLNAFHVANGESVATDSTEADGSFALATGTASVHLSFHRNGLWLYYIGQPTLSKKWTQAQTIRLTGSSVELEELTFATNAYIVSGVVVDS